MSELGRLILRERTPKEVFGAQIGRVMQLSLEDDWRGVEFYLERALSEVSTILWNDCVSKDSAHETPGGSVETSRRSIVDEVLAS